MSESRIGRREVVRRGAAAALSLLTCGRARITAAAEFDIVLKGGTILDGTGGPSFTADLGIRGDTVAAIGAVDAGQGSRVLDIRGLHVAPGFIEATFESPHRYPSGIDLVLVNGVTVVEKGSHTGARPGRMLRRS